MSIEKYILFAYALYINEFMDAPMAEKRPYKNPQFNLRLPADLKEQIEKAAARSGRSMNAEIVNRIVLSFMFDNDQKQAIQSAEDGSQVRNIHELTKEFLMKEAKEAIAKMSGRILTESYIESLKELARKEAIETIKNKDLES